MPPRSKSLVVLAFVLFAVYLLFWHDDKSLDYGQPPPPSQSILDAYLADLQAAEEAEADRKAADAAAKGYIDLSEDFEEPETPEPEPEPEPESEPGPEPDPGPEPEPEPEPALEPPELIEAVETSTSSADVVIATADPEPPRRPGKTPINLKADFERDYAALEQQETAGLIYGTTLKDLTDHGVHEGPAAAALTPTESFLQYSDTPPYKFNPYPEYNSKAWKAASRGTYKPCGAPGGLMEDMLVFSGRPKAFGEPPMGSYIALEIDSNLCFERKTRLGRYGFQEDNSTILAGLSETLGERADLEPLNWGHMQQECARRNSDRYDFIQGISGADNFSFRETSNSSNSSAPFARRGKSRRLETIPVEDSQNNGEESSPGIPGTKSRTAIVVRTRSGQEYTENDKQNIRALITELSLGSGGEYQVYLLVQVKDETLPILTDVNAYNEAVQNSVPKEFWNMTILWNDAQMKELYPLILPTVNNVHQSQWLSMQKFAQDYPHFDYYWNWEFDTRYTGHYYDLLEKLGAFAKAQPRKYLWERNERYYIPSFHGPYSKFQMMVEPQTDKDTIWGPPPNPKISPVGPVPPVFDPKEDDYTWGVGEEADYISLAPLFNPVLTKWVGKHDIWGFLGPEETPRRAAIGTQSRCSKLLLDTMHEENLRGNHASSEMTPQTVALLHGLKAVYAPIPVFFDRAWGGKLLAKYFNPGPNGESGNTAQSPFSWGNEVRFNGSTWYYRATPPMRLYNNWLGWEDNAIGGPEWEETHGRACLPPMLLHPIKDPVQTPPGYSSKSSLPYET